MGAGVPTGGSDWTLIFFGGFGVAAGVAVAVAAGAVVAAAVCFARGTRASGSVLRESAATACAVTHTGVCRLVRE